MAQVMTWFLIFQIYVLVCICLKGFGKYLSFRQMKNVVKAFQLNILETQLVFNTSPTQTRPREVLT